MFEAEDLTSLLKGTETEFLAKIDALVLKLAATPSSERKALIRKQIKDLRQRMRDAAQRVFLDLDVRVVISTAFRATAFLKSEDAKAGLKEGFAPFTTVFIDEAGLVSRAAVAALSLLASRRVVLVGDSKQLAPISKISRILPTNQMTWLANSGLSHLDSITTSETGVHVLQEQRRMHADVCSVVSDYQYDGFLTTAPESHNREYPFSDLLRGQSRTIWYVLDEDGEDLPTIRAERGPGNRSWVRVSKTRIAAR
jgi:superfamily I DNA and/or RNA helicase